MTGIKYRVKNKRNNYKKSNKMHIKLANIHKKKSNGEDTHFIKAQYHTRCIHLQNKDRRILTATEKLKVYNDVISTFF